MKSSSSYKTYKNDCLEVVRDLTSAGADILHQVLAPGFGQLDRLPLLHRTIQGGQSC